VASLNVTESEKESVEATASGSPRGAPGTPPDKEPPDLRKLLDAYERSLILAALGAVGGRQRSAAQLLRILPSTLCEKMKRLGIRPQRVQKLRTSASPEVCASLHWKGSVPPGGTLEVRGLNGPVRIEAGDDDRIEVSATRRGPRSIFSAVEVKIIEHSRGVTVCAVCQGLEASASRRLERRVSRGVASVRVDLVARVPPGVHVIASTVNDDIEVVGLTSNIEADTTNGRVRFISAPSPEAAEGPRLGCEEQAPTSRRPE
jgi:hypothetical protein